MTLRTIAARVDRLEELARGLAKELTLLSQADDPLLYVERKTYLNALGRVLSGVEEARVVLARSGGGSKRAGVKVPARRVNQARADFACTVARWTVS